MQECKPDSARHPQKRNKSLVGFENAFVLVAKYSLEKPNS